ncbi:uncharacterized protein PAC_17981 [Phialocephala subalpina]|uniref:C2H2-type domain-containing protein n=1 Tax=Phialocephala subalpina TaxID=576137 RepID=A0A1L7XSR1_9HELO|nr:uncharacterized protein PAC_17981 [Phialocephala subalpina]
MNWSSDYPDVVYTTVTYKQSFATAAPGSVAVLTPTTVSSVTPSSPTPIHHLIPAAPTPTYTLRASSVLPVSTLGLIVGHRAGFVTGFGLSFVLIFLTIFAIFKARSDNRSTLREPISIDNNTNSGIASRTSQLSVQHVLRRRHGEEGPFSTSVSLAEKGLPISLGDHQRSQHGKEKQRAQTTVRKTLLQKKRFCPTPSQALPDKLPEIWQEAEEGTETLKGGGAMILFTIVKAIFVPLVFPLLALLYMVSAAIIYASWILILHSSSLLGSLFSSSRASGLEAPEDKITEPYIPDLPPGVKHNIGLPLEVGQVTQDKMEQSSEVPHYIESQNDSTSSEDITDWEDTSDEEDSLGASRFLLPGVLGGKSGAEPDVFEADLTTIKSKLIEKLMLDFWAIFDNSWQNSMKKHGSSAQPSSSSTNSESGSLSRESSSAGYGKRHRSDDKEDEENNDDQDRRRKIPPGGKLPIVEEDESHNNQFSCPFRKHDPRKYSVQGWPRCALKPQKTIARLKAHLYQYHLIEQCSRCKSVFESEAALEAHSMSEERCEPKIDEHLDGMTRKMKDQIQCRRKPHPGQTDEEKWQHIYKILFPDGTVVHDPYFEQVPDHDIQRTQSPGLVNLAQYESYLRRVLPGLVRNALGEAVNNELRPIEAQLQRRMMDIIQEAQNRAFMSFRNTRLSETQARPLSAFEVNMDSPTDDQPGTTSIEAFFQPPPPANLRSFPSTNLESFLNLSDLRIPQRNMGQPDSSDSGYASRLSLSISSRHASSDVLERDAAFSPRNNDQGQMNSDSNLDTAPFDITQLLNLNQTHEASASSWPTHPQTPPNLDSAASSELDLSSIAAHHASLPDQPGHTTENALPEDPWYPDTDLIDINHFE